MQPTAGAAIWWRISVFQWHVVLNVTTGCLRGTIVFKPRFSKVQIPPWVPLTSSGEPLPHYRCKAPQLCSPLAPGVPFLRAIPASREGSRHRPNGVFASRFFRDWGDSEPVAFLSPMTRISFPWGRDGHCLFACPRLRPGLPPHTSQLGGGETASWASRAGSHPTRGGSSGSGGWGSRTRASSFARSPPETRKARQLWAVPGGLVFHPGSPNLRGFSLKALRA